MNRWILTDKVYTEYNPIVEAFVDKVNGYSEEEMANFESLDTLYETTLDMSDTKLNPSTLGIILKRLGYEKGEDDTSGWEANFTTTYTKDNCRSITLNSCGMTFELKLSISDS